MKRKSVSSSVLASIGYDPKSRLLEVEFNHGEIYQYSDVPEKVYKELINADSIGKYYSDNVRDDYEFVRLR